MKSDIEIARSIRLRPIGEIAERLGIPQEELEPYGKNMAKVPLTLIDEEKVKKSKKKGSSLKSLSMETLLNNCWLEVVISCTKTNQNGLQTK